MEDQSELVKDNNKLRVVWKSSKYQTMCLLCTKIQPIICREAM